MDKQPNSSPTSSQTTQWQPSKRNPLRNIFFATLTLCGVLLALYVWDLPPFKNAIVSTNNAYVRGTPTLISSKVNGYVEKIFVHDFDEVKAGQPLLQIEQDSYRAKLAQAKATLASQEAALAKIMPSRQSAVAIVDVRQAAINSAQIALNNAKTEFARQQEMMRDNATSRQTYDNAHAAVLQAQATLDQAKAQKTASEQEVVNIKPSTAAAQAAVENARAAVDLAQQDLDHTLIIAPISGKLNEIGTRQGQYVSTGSSLLYIVPPKHWIIANLKETDTEKVKIGQPVTISIDALGGQKLHGKVTQISPATGSEFSLNKTDTSTGNFVKVAQRIAIKISLDEQQPNYARLLPGMSAEIEIDTSK